MLINERAGHDEQDEQKQREARGFKFPMLEYIFNQRTASGTKAITENHTFTLKDISDAYKALGIPEPASISNTILDLTRKDRGIESRLPQSIIKYGYDLKKKTGAAKTGERANYAGEFVYVGIGNTLHSWHHWRTQPDREIILENKVPARISTLLSRDEGALFSVIDYCDVLSYAFHGRANTIIRVQNPMKWQPNEIDGLYFSDEEEPTLYPIEAKALSTGDDLNLEQMLGGLRTIQGKIQGVKITPLGIQMIENGMRIGLFKEVQNQHEAYLEIELDIVVRFDPPIVTWYKTARRRKEALQRSTMQNLFSNRDL